MCLRTYPLAHRRVLLRIAFQVGVKVCHQDDEVKCSVPQFGLGHLEWLNQPIEAHPLCLQKFISSIWPYKRHFFLCTWGQWFLADISEVSTLQTPCLSLVCLVWPQQILSLVNTLSPSRHPQLLLLPKLLWRSCYSLLHAWFVVSHEKKKKKNGGIYSLLGPLNIDISSHQILRALL